MLASLQTALLRLPGSQRLITGVVADIRDRRCVLLVVPPVIDYEQLFGAIQQELDRYWIETKLISLAELPAQLPPAAALGQYLGVTWPSTTCSRTPQDLLAAKDLPIMLWLDGFMDLGEAPREAWFRFLDTWARVGGTAPATNEPPAMVLITPPGALPRPLPQLSPTLSIRWWWGIPSALEARLLCRMVDDGDDATAQWREHVLPAFVGGDFELMELLWDIAGLGVSDLVRRLREDGLRRGWSTDLLKEWGATKFLARTSPQADRRNCSPPYQHQQIWSNGALNCTREFGTELHASALALLGEERELGRRLWRGQVPLLLPLVDEIRLSVCEFLTSNYGKGWPHWYKNLLPQSSEEQAAIESTPYACQLGFLANLLRKGPRFCHLKELRQLVELARRIRNDLSHYRPVPFLDFQALLQERRHCSTRHSSRT